MKIFFTGSPRALKSLTIEHETIYETIQKLGHTHLSDTIIKADPDKFYRSEYFAASKYFQEIMHHIKSSDVVIAEVSTHSLSVGFIIQQALQENKFVIALYLPHHKPFLLNNMTSEKLQIIEYRIKDIETVLFTAFKKIAELSDTRFNFFIPPEISRYLEWVNKTKKIPRSVYIRNLLERAMRLDRDYHHKVSHNN